MAESGQSGRWVSRPDETIEQYRLRMLEDRVAPLEDAVREISRLRRDGAVAVICVMVALAISSPQVWGVVVVWAGSVVRAARGAAS